MQTWQVILIIVAVFGFVGSNIALLKYSAKLDMKRLNQDPVEKARQRLKEKQRSAQDEHCDKD
ncbi:MULTISPECIES: DUF2897 family protein [Pseudoalteromonas]|uniref:DUF2897 domain-containing protein n=1 Tax=Pseudoalteromonas ruthenica TaxID=151081 RepID=A0A0F4Q4F4_9GAMM|nr:MULTISPECIES: DUF2897 family protein [Pseudoalteromonas]KJY98193.1 hypothetical protein TW76_06700 [Pseudoalteromonas ruthenica]KJZ02260.1 hypothetical protein TW72_00910 [Pseudoalteromonas ruthenica]MCF2861123.1 DUF2897 family protein [Pseudoalteromonas sp. CNAT2-18]MCG7545008.1 DUF2897 family protein [Pseudoalteromonas sp. MM17-2]MCG7556992.1 DUF2897 family protein [Pseudoalteromonas sp. CNAT2-18.1]|tara:strand:- start:3951 stop:4139 length:189 start_codon:yes stop_codon:yes gene_type:complete